MKKSILYLSIILLVSPLLFSQSEESASAPILIVEKRPEVQTDAGQKTVVEKETWENKGARTVSEAVQFTPGVTVTKTGTTMGDATVSIRGVEGKQVLVMINGIPLNNGKGDAVNLNTLSLKNVEKIEVIRGGNSAVYGEGAFGGVINLITKNEAPLFPEGEVYTSAGSFQTYVAGGNLKFPLNSMGTLSGKVSAEFHTTLGTYEYESSQGDVTRGNSEGWADNAETGLEWNIGGMDRHMISLDASWYQGSRGIPGLMEFLTPEATLEDSRLGLSSRYIFKGYDGETLDAGFSFSMQDAHFENTENQSESDNSTLSHRGRTDFSKEIPLGLWSLTPFAGITGSRETLESTSLRSSNGTSLPGRAEQNELSCYTRIVLAGEQLTLTPAYRWDAYTTEYVSWENNEDSYSSWALTASYTLPNYDKLTFKGNIGTAYHSPGFDDLFWSGGSFAEGNPGLLPEENFNWDGGAYYKPRKGLDFSAVYFWSQTENLIQWLPTAGGTWRPTNIGQVDSRGVESTLSWLLPLKMEKSFLEVNGSHSFILVTDSSEDSINLGNQLSYRPVHSGSGSLSLLKNKQSLTFSGRYIGQRFTNMANTKYLDPVLTFDSVLKLVLTKGFTFSLSVLNLSDIQYIDKLGYPIPGREWSVTGGYRF